MDDLDSADDVVVELVKLFGGHPELEDCPAADLPDGVGVLLPHANLYGTIEIDMDAHLDLDLAA